MLLNISHRSELTLQDQIVSQLRARILSGELQADAPLPSIRALSRDLRVGINTVQNAYDQLLREELIYVRAARGFFVRPLAKGDKTALAQKSFATELKKLVDKARDEGLSEAELKRIFNRLQAGERDGNA